MTMTSLSEALGLEADAVGEPSGIGSELNSSLGKAMALLAAFDRRTPIGVSELARKADLTKSTAFRLLGLLVDWQLVERVESRYQLGVRLFELGNRFTYCCQHGLRDIAHPFLEDLYESTHETAHLAILDGSDVLYIDKVFGHQHVSSPSQIGSRLPAYSTALGKSLLAYGDAHTLDRILSAGLKPSTPYTITQPNLLIDELRTIAEQGVSFDNEEVRAGVVCVGAAVLDAKGLPIAAISIAGASGRFDPRRNAAKVREAAAAIGARMRGRA